MYYPQVGGRGRPASEVRGVIAPTSLPLTKFLKADIAERVG